MSSRAVIIRTNPGGQQKWSTPHSCALAVVVVVFAVMAVSSLWAQTSTTGDIVGVVTDPTAAVLSGVSVTLKNVDTGSSTSATTNSQGSYNFPFLQPGHYAVSATAAGFQEIVKNGTVALGSSVTANLQLSISSQSQTIEVTGEGTGIQTEDANLEANINAQQLAVLPNPGNDLSAVALTAPGVVMNTTSGSVFGGGNYEFFGLPSNSNAFTYDGANENDPYFNINKSGATNLTLGLNDVQETSVVTNGYAGQFGGLAGANINYLSKSGTNAFRGNAEYWWNARALNSNNYFRNQANAVAGSQVDPRPFVNANQYAASFGGPIRKNKLLALAVSAHGQSLDGTGHRQSLHAHRLNYPAPVSLLPDTGPMPDAAAGLERRYSGKRVDVLTYHYDSARTGWNQDESDLTPAAVSSNKFGLLTTLKVDGNVLAQPLLVSRFVMRDGRPHDVLIVATGHNTVYAYDAQTYTVLWRVSLGQPQATGDVGCGDMQPEYGISSTPVIMRHAANAATLYVVSATEPSSFDFHTQLHALNLATGKDVQPPVEISPSATLSDGSTLSFDPQNQWSRTGLAASNGSVYIGFGSHCDSNSGSISGWLPRFSANLASQAAFHTIETPSGGTELASIWMTGFAPAIDDRGNLFVVTGNGDVSGNGSDWGQSALSLNPTLSTVRGHFTPSSFSVLNDGDQDFGSGGIMLIPPVAKQTVPPLAVAIGKSAVLYLLDQNRLGGLRPNDTGALQAITLTERGNAGLWGGPAYYDGANGPTVFLQTDSDVLRAFSVATTGRPALTQAMTGTTQAGNGGALLVVSSNGSKADTGVVWVIRRSVPMELEAYNADTLGAPLFHANAGVWSNTSSQNSYVTPVEVNGRIYAPAYKTVKVFGLKP